MSIGIHNFGVLAMMAVVAVNIAMLAMSGEMVGYARRMRIFMPVSASMITVIIFTGMVMMAAKHLSFTIENVVMILFSVVLIVLESKRYYSLKHIRRGKDATFEGYRAKAMKIMGGEMLFLALIAAWMLLA